MGTWRAILVCTCCACAPAAPVTPGVADSSAVSPSATALPTANDAAPSEVSQMGEAGAKIDAAVAGAISRGEVPGAVVVVVHEGRVVFRKAYGSKRPGPQPAPMTTDTVFDLASLTKPLATATSVLALVEDGKLALRDRAAKHLPELARSALASVTIEQLLLHTSGLPPGTPLEQWRGGREAVLAKLAAVTPKHLPGETFEYSDLGYVLLGELVARVSGEPLDAFFARRFAGPLGLHDTTFRPGPELARRSAPTESRARSLGRSAASPDDAALAGEVHDPRAHLLGGVAGHAGLFSTADDVAALVEALAGGGARGGARVLSAATTRELLRLRQVPGGMRSLAFSGLAVGQSHTGFTGTYVWLDPTRRTVMVLLASRLQSERGDATTVRRQVLDAVVGWKHDPARVQAATVQSGIDVLAADGFRAIANLRVGLLTNASVRDRAGNKTLDVLRAAPGVRLTALFSPEHGLGADRDGNVDDARDPETGIVVHSLYGKTRRPSAAQLEAIDAIVIDLQDAGTRFYTYAATVLYVLEAASAANKRVVILDRPNPIDGITIEGPTVDAGRESFVAFHSIPIRHGMTLGELARLVVAERKLSVRLDVVTAKGWDRRMRFDRTGLTWTNPSPNLKSPIVALLYPAVGLLETTNVSVGRGTDRPLARVGAPWIDGAALSRALATAGLKGVKFTPTRFSPSSGPFANTACNGVDLDVTDAEAFEPVRTGLEIARALRRLHGATFELRKMDALLVSRRVLDALERGDPTDGIVASYRQELDAFEKRRAPHLLY